VADKNEAQEALLGAVQRRAMEIIELPAGEREARYAMYRRNYVESAIETGMPRDQAEEFGDKMIEWTQGMVQLMEQGGGAAGGKA
jgi:hypothetical protein